VIDKEPGSQRKVGGKSPSSESLLAIILLSVSMMPIVPNSNRGTNNNQHLHPWINFNLTALRILSVNLASPRTKRFRVQYRDPL
jgi:hypothetical protein